jgi:hypothetical protein
MTTVKAQGQLRWGKWSSTLALHILTRRHPQNTNLDQYIIWKKSLKYIDYSKGLRATVLL